MLSSAPKCLTNGQNELSTTTSADDKNFKHARHLAHYFLLKIVKIKQDPHNETNHWEMREESSLGEFSVHKISGPI